MSLPWIATKFHLPSITSKNLRRPRLLDRLDESLDENIRLVLVCAPAGYGKTTLVSDWLQSPKTPDPGPFAWLTLERGDDDLSHFLTYFITTVQQISTGFGASVLQMLFTHKPPPVTTLATLLVNEINEIPRRFLLVLDDYHNTSSKPIQDFIAFLVDLDAFKLYLSGQGVNPHTRQSEAAKRREQAVQAKQSSLKGLRLKWFNQFLAPAQKYAPLREDGLAEIGLAYPLLRQMLLEVGRRFFKAGVIVEAGDIFWLTQAEVQRIAERVDSHQPAKSLAAEMVQRKAERQAALRTHPPMALPQMKVFGFDLMSLKEKKRGRGNKGNLIQGVAASPGQVTGTARVLHGPADFCRMQVGDVLVAPITTPAWTPLFAMAAAVVTDVGGPLSHGSIVAREYGIPAVLGTGIATRRIQDGQTITVDGSAGTILLLAS